MNTIKKRLIAAVYCLLGRSVMYKMNVSFADKSVISQTKSAVVFNNTFLGIEKIG